MAEILDRLNDIINDKEEEIKKLENEIDALELEKEQASWLWARHSVIKDDCLPVPRVQLEYKSIKYDGAYFVGEWILSIVYKDIVGNSINVPLSQTKVTCSDVSINKNEPYRDGIHFRHNVKTLGLPGYVIIDGNAKLIEVSNSDNETY